MKEIIGSYSQLNGCVFSCFWMLLKRLIESNTLCLLRFATGDGPSLR